MNKVMMCVALMAMLFVTDALGADIATQKVARADSSMYGYVTINLEVPKGDDAVATSIRNTLWGKLIETLGPQCCYYDDDNSIKAYTGGKDFDKLAEYYCTEAFNMWNARMKAENDENHEAIMSNDELTAEQKAEYVAEIRQYGFDVTLSKTADNNRYVIFSENVYGYAGGAHGAAFGWGCVTFDKKTGKQLKSIIKPGMTRAMQPLLKRGLKEYFSEGSKANSMTDYELYEQLMIDGKVIPLPAQYGVYPSKDGMVFVYGQYEIACYAAGMPSFTIPYSKIKPYLTEEAKKVLGLNNAVRK